MYRRAGKFTTIATTGARSEPNRLPVVTDCRLFAVDITQSDKKRWAIRRWVLLQKAEEIAELARRAQLADVRRELLELVERLRRLAAHVEGRQRGEAIKLPCSECL